MREPHGVLSPLEGRRVDLPGGHLGAALSPSGQDLGHSSSGGGPGSSMLPFFLARFPLCAIVMRGGTRALGVLERFAETFALTLPCFEIARPPASESREPAVGELEDLFAEPQALAIVRDQERAALAPAD